MSTFSLFGGYNYNGCVDVQADSLEQAAEQWYDRYSSNGLRRVDGVVWPCWGDMPDDSLAVGNFDTDQYMTRAEVLALFPF